MMSSDHTKLIAALQVQPARTSVSATDSRGCRVVTFTQQSSAIVVSAMLTTADATHSLDHQRTDDPVSNRPVQHLEAESVNG